MKKNLIIKTLVNLFIKIKKWLESDGFTKLPTNIL
jgi:hypothetical protein